MNVTNPLARKAILELSRESIQERNLTNLVNVTGLLSVAQIIENRESIQKRNSTYVLDVKNHFSVLTST